MTTKKLSDEATNVREPNRGTVWLVFVGVAANAVTQFAIQAYMSYRFAKDVWDIPQVLCVGVICALDLFAVMFMVFTYLLRTAKWQTQIYVWFVFAAGVGAQLFAAELYGAHEHWEPPVRVFAALPALFLAASLHGLIIWRNHSAASAPTVEHSEKQPSAPSDIKQEREPEAAPVKQGRPAKRSTVASFGRPGNPNREQAVSRVLAGEDTGAVATDLGVTRRAVQIWVQKAQEDPPVIPQVNGHEFHADGPTEVAIN